MLSRMAPSSPPVKRTLHLLKTPDILLANDSGPLGSYVFDNSTRRCCLLSYFRVDGQPTATSNVAFRDSKNGRPGSHTTFRQLRSRLCRERGPTRRGGQPLQFRAKNRCGRQLE